MSGKLFGIGIGPGDPELLTIKGKRILEESQVIVFPGEEPKETIAYEIISQIVDLSGKLLVGISFPMTKDIKILEKSHRQGAIQIARHLEQGIDVVFPTLGDPTVYATYIYVHKLIMEMGYETEIIPGVTSFCAAAAKINEALVETSEQLHIIPSSYGVQEALKLPGTKVLMKAGRKLNEVYKLAKGSRQKVWVLQNIGMENERVYGERADEIEPGYFTLFIIKEEKETE